MPLGTSGQGQSSASSTSQSGRVEVEQVDCVESEYEALGVVVEVGGGDASDLLSGVHEWHVGAVEDAVCAGAVYEELDGAVFTV